MRVRNEPRRMKLFLFALLLVLIATGACFNVPAGEYKVLRKSYSPAHTYSHYDRGAFRAPSLITRDYPASWDVQIRSTAASFMANARVLCVTQAQFNQLKVGQHIWIDITTTNCWAEFRMADSTGGIP